MKLKTHWTRLAMAGGAAAVLMASGVVVRADDMGVCNYTMKNMFAGPYKVCETNIDEATCLGRANEDENSNASFSAGPCATEGAVGTCTTADHATTYYEGEPSSLEIGCGFQAGEWETAGE